MLVVVSTACGCEAVYAVLALRPAKQWRVARAAREQHTHAVLSYAAAAAGVTLRRWHLLATDIFLSCQCV